MSDKLYTQWDAYKMLYDEDKRKGQELEKIQHVWSEWLKGKITYKDLYTTLDNIKMQPDSKND